MLTSRASLIQLTLPEYHGRHLFTARLRIAVFIGFWALYLYFYKNVLEQTWEITLIMSLSFVITAVAYYNVIRERWLLFSLLLELAADLVAITVVVYLTGGPFSPYFTLYIFYCFAAGVFYNHILAGLLALCSLVTYGAFQLACWWGVIPPLILDYGDKPPVYAATPHVLFMLMAVFMLLVVYGVKIVSFFNKQRELALERRNVQLTALHDMSATIRSVEELDTVIRSLLSNAIRGLGFETAIFLLIDRDEKKVVVHTPGKHPMLNEIVATVGFPIEGLQLPLSALETPALSQVMNRQIVFRRDVVEATEGLRDVISEETARTIQNLLRIHKVIGIPLVAEGEVMGAMVGFAREQFVEEAAVETLEAFANQAALNLEASRLVDVLTRTNQELRVANEVKTEFLAIMSHELRTPLTAIIGFSELLMEGVMGDLSTEQKESLQEVLNNGADLLEMINSLLDLSKIESGKMKLDRNLFDLRETLERVESATASLIQRKQQAFTVDSLPELPPVSGDERKIQQIFLNLLSNAIKFTPIGGNITLRVTLFESWEAIAASASWAERVAAKKDAFAKGAVVIEVHDTGCGIETKHLESVFDMFQQVDSSITRSFGGTGLGLALAKQFVELHGGVIWAESEVGAGAKFTVVIPVNAG